VVRAEEKPWTEFKVWAAKKTRSQTINWLWVVTQELDGYGCRTIWNLGHGRWRIENNAFNVLTKHWHCGTAPIMNPTSFLACLLITLLAFQPFMPLLCSTASSIGKARSPCKSCACNSIER